VSAGQAATAQAGAAHDKLAAAIRRAIANPDSVAAFSAALEAGENYARAAIAAWEAITAPTAEAQPASGQTVMVNVAGTEVSVEVREGWSTIAPVTTAARWAAGCGTVPFDSFEVRDDNGVLLDPHARLGAWLHGRTLFVNLPAGTGG
jgi:hypothetical protein